MRGSGWRWTRDTAVLKNRQAVILSRELDRVRKHEPENSVSFGLEAGYFALLAYWKEHSVERVGGHD